MICWSSNWTSKKDTKSDLSGFECTHGCCCPMGKSEYFRNFLVLRFWTGIPNNVVKKMCKSIVSYLLWLVLLPNTNVQDAVVTWQQISCFSQNNGLWLMLISFLAELHLNWTRFIISFPEEYQSLLCYNKLWYTHLLHELMMVAWERVS